MRLVTSIVTQTQTASAMSTPPETIDNHDGFTAIPRDGPENHDERSRGPAVTMLLLHSQRNDQVALNHARMVSAEGEGSSRPVRPRA